MAEGLRKWAAEEKNKKFVIVIVLVILLVIGLTFIPMNKGNQPVVKTVQRMETSERNDYASVLEKKLTIMLSKMDGVGSVSVMVTLNANEEKVLAEDTSSQTQRTEERDQAGGTRNTDSLQQSHDVVLQNGNIPYVVKEYAPEIRGVLILAEGAGDSMVKNQITEAVSKLLDVPVHKISVEKKKN